MTLTGDEAWAFHAELRARQEKERAETLASAKVDAEARNKEPFDLGRLESMADTSSEGRLAPDDVRHARFEYMYYVDYPDILTLEEFAAKLRWLNTWS